jgi:manganese oxidase
MFLHFTRVHRPTCTLGVLAAAALLWAPFASAENPSSHAAMNHQLPAWAEQLKGQTIIEDTMSGKGSISASWSIWPTIRRCRASTPVCTTPRP